MVTKFKKHAKRMKRIQSSSEDDPRLSNEMYDSRKDLKMNCSDIGAKKRGDT